MDIKLYNRYLTRGLFDPDHIIGKLYHKPWMPAIGEWKVVKVQMFEVGQSSRYHCILAKPPSNWNAITEATPFKDVSTAGFSTTLGPASFYEPMQNKPDVTQLHSLIHPGQPRKVSCYFPCPFLPCVPKGANRKTRETPKGFHPQDNQPHRGCSSVHTSFPYCQTGV
ncbi:hypothetical protein C8F04DRAFT_716732 [Mycena alexandri]|uniref:Uncharacterized protein n=1 Tax=Mycena alexandri TaxID=1745969 RepID=A0AAD6SMQ5_9AGAR|nr:hypothetical protein C8F04DRAFT_716732 [Mycena alexandri]